MEIWEMETRFPNATDGIPDHDSLAGINAYASRRRLCTSENALFRRTGSSHRGSANWSKGMYT